MKGFVDYVDTNTPNEHVSEQLDQGNFTSFVYRHIPDTQNEHLKGVKNPYFFELYIGIKVKTFIQYPPSTVRSESWRVERGEIIGRTNL